MLVNLKKVIMVLLPIVAIMAASCSSRTSNPLTPEAAATDTPPRIAEGHAILGVFEMTLDPESGDVSLVRDREISVHYDVTDYLFPPECPDCIGIHFIGIDPTSGAYNIQVNLRNPSSMTAYDVRAIILWKDDDLRGLVNAEAYTTIFDDGGTKNKNPFKTFRDVLDPTNSFVGGEIKSEFFQIWFPPPQNFNVKFVVEASFPGNSKDPWLISSEDVSNDLDISGEITATVSCRVLDHENDISSVTLDLTSLGFPGTVPMSHTTEVNWSVDISNDYNQPPGLYTLEIVAQDEKGKWPIYDYISVKVVEDIEAFVYVDSNYTGSSNGTEEKPYKTITTAMGNFDPGQIIKVLDGTYVESLTLVQDVHLIGYGPAIPVIRGIVDPLIYSGTNITSATVENFILQGNGTSVDYAIQLVESVNTVFKNLDFVSTGAVKSFKQVIHAEGAANLRIADCRFQNLTATGGAPILISINSSNEVVLESNFVKNFHFNPGSYFPTGTGAVVYLNGCDNVWVKQNLIGSVYGQTGQFDNLDFSGYRVNGGSGITFMNNLIYDLNPTGDCDLDLAGVTINGTDTYAFHHMTIDRIGDELQETGNTYGLRLMFGSDNELINNLVTNIVPPDPGSGWGVHSSHSALQTYSDVWATGDDDTFRYGQSASEGVGGLNVNPEYAAPGSGDYHLLGSSPCLTTGKGGVQMGAYGGVEPLDLPVE